MEVEMRKHETTQTELPKGRDVNDPLAHFQSMPKMLTPLLESVNMSLVFGDVQL